MIKEETKKLKSFRKAENKKLHVFLVSLTTLHVFSAVILKMSEQRQRQQIRLFLVKFVDAQTCLVELVIFHLPKLIIPNDCCCCTIFREACAKNVKPILGSSVHTCLKKM